MLGIMVENSEKTRGAGPAKLLLDLIIAKVHEGAMRIQHESGVYNLRGAG